MAAVVYDWTRFWCPREGQINLSDNGFLYNPEAEYGTTINPHVRKFEQVTTTPCLVLLGEPGIGKSHELKRAWQSEESAARARGDVALPFELRAFSTDTLLCSRIFDSAAFQEWRAGTHRLYLFLDSIDEGLLRITSLAELLAQELGRCDIKRLSLRITCRTAEWPHSLEESLKGLWGEANISVLELAPLRRRDVQAAAEAEGLDAERFPYAVQDKHAVPLAIKPITLRMLMNVFRGTGTFPLDQAELYEQGCQRLCEEQRDTGTRPSVTVDVLFAAASRIAAATVFGNRYAIWTGLDDGSVPPGDVTTRQIAGGTETVGTTQVHISEDIIRAAMKTGLFSSRGPHRLGWAHQTYAEFLAARYVVASGMTDLQVLSLIVHPNDPGEKLVPQLHETAAWIAGLRPAVFQSIMGRDPEVLLRSDVAAVEPEDRRRLVDAILSIYGQEKFTAQSWDLQGHYHKLAHTDIADQLRPSVVDKNANWLVRRVAIDMAEACDVVALVPDLVRIALDQSEDTEVRKNAAYAVIGVGDSPAKAQLKPLALGQSGADPQDDLKGCGLQAVWPDHMTAQELFQVLTPRRRRNWTGSYGMFRFYLRRDLPKQLKPEDLVFALRWAAQGYADDYDVRDLSEWIITTAWDALDQRPELAIPFAEVALLHLRRHKPIAEGPKEKPFSQTIAGDGKKRHLVLQAAMNTLTSRKDTFALTCSETPLAPQEDLFWVIEQTLSTPAERRAVWLGLLDQILNPYRPDHLEAAIALAKREPTLSTSFPWLQGVEIESPRGRKMKADFLKHKRLEEQMDGYRHPPLLTPPPRARVLVLLDKFESGDTNVWWHLNMEMTLEPASTHYGDVLEWNLTELPGWRDADEVTRRRVISAAKRYVANPPAMDNSWLGTNTLHHPACAGYRAIALVLAVDSAFVHALPADVWAAWAPIIIAFPLHSSSLWDKAPHTDLVRLAYEKAPDAVLTSLKVCWWESDRIDHCWDDRIANVLFERIQSHDIEARHFESLIHGLLEHHYGPAVAFALSLVSVPTPTDPERRTTALATAQALLTHCAGVAWPDIWKTVQADADFGRNLFEDLFHAHDDKSLSRLQGELSEQQVADLYLWLAAQYPHKEDPQRDEAGTVTPREAVAWLREGVLNHLKSRGTPDACAQVRRIAAQLPDVEYLKWVVQEAEAATRQKTWQPLRAEQVIALAQDRQRRYVGNGRQLLDLLVESLEHLQEVLQGRNPAVVELWDNRGNMRKKVWCPVDEPRMSDWIARHLHERLSARGIVVNREVQIRRGELTDIHIDAVVPATDGQTARTISAIIEAKGCWHHELNTAMESQLVDRYLKENQCPHGLYLIGWFNCDRWADKDARKRDAPKYSLDEAKARFALQAEELQSKAAVPGLVLRSVILNTYLR
jgi:hypothetical protein